MTGVQTFALPIFLIPASQNHSSAKVVLVGTPKQLDYPRRASFQRCMTLFCSPSTVDSNTLARDKARAVAHQQYYHLGDFLRSAHAVHRMERGNGLQIRSEERRVGNEWVSTWRYRGSQDI